MAVLESPTKLLHAADVMTKDVVTCFPDATLSEAAREMWENDLGFLVVVRRGERRPVGVLTDRDVCMAAYIQGRRLTEIPVHTAMARLVHAVEAGASMDDVHTMMRDKQLRRVPVVNGNGELTGVVGLADLARKAADVKGARELTETLRDVTRPRPLSPAVPDPIC
jgi:CBS domain-containing protein